ncbi:Putative adhesin [Lachnospiraceae bacterium A10]|nr:Putative adhesin [Lachnospiraceae bacterium A10]
MKKTIYLFVLTVITIAAILVGISIHMGGFSLEFFRIGHWFGNVNSGDEISTSANLDEFTTVHLDASALDITLVSGNDFKMEYEGSEKLRPEVNVDQGVLTVEQKASGHLVRSMGGDLVITVPEGTAMDTIEMEVSAGDIEVENILANTVKLEVSAGDIDVVGGSIETIDVDCSAGDVDIEKCEFNNLTTDLSAGDMDVTVTDSVKNYEIEADASLGNVYVDGKKEGASYEQGGSGTKYMKIDVSAGDISIEEDE